MASENKKTYLPNVVTGASIRDGSGQIIDERFKKVEKNVDDLTKRVDNLDKYDKIKCVPTQFDLPSASKAQENTLYVIQDTGRIYIWHNSDSNIGYKEYINSFNCGDAKGSIEVDLDNGISNENHDVDDNK